MPRSFVTLTVPLVQVDVSCAETALGFLPAQLAPIKTGHNPVVADDGRPLISSMPEMLHPEGDAEELSRERKQNKC